jgi:CubicO group peptidase (beta-lactamase class C family)
MLLSHQAGLPAVRELLADDAMYDWETMTGALAAERPWWEPGTTHGYHVNTFGFLAGELVRRVSGRPVGEFFAEEVAGPLGADFRFGVAPGDEARVADFQFTQETLAERDAPPAEIDPERRELLARAYFNPPGAGGINGYVNSPGWRAAVMPSTNGHATARGVASIYGALAAGSGPLAEDVLAQAIAVASSGPDRVLGRVSRFGLGFQLTHPDRPLGHGPRSFGHFGAGGSLGFADPDARLGFGYTMNRGGPRWQNPRNRVLVDALYRCL